MGDNVEVDDVNLLCQKLIDEFRSSIEDTIVIAIAGDFDLNQQYDKVRAILLTLSQHVTAEEESGFNPSGMGYSDDIAGLEFPIDSMTTDSTHSSRLHTDLSSRTDVSDSLSDRFEALELPQDIDVSRLDDNGKTRELKIMFPALKEVDITFALKKATGDFMKACEDLLNTQYLEENGLQLRGIEGAFHPHANVKNRKGKQRSTHQHHKTGLSRSHSLDGHRNTDTAQDRPGKTRLDVDYRLASLPDIELEEATPVSKRSRSVTPAVFPRASAVRESVPHLVPGSTPASSSTSSAPTSPMLRSSEWQTVVPKKKTFTELSQISSAARASSNDTWDAATYAARKGKSDHLFKPVAAVLAERARNQAAQAKIAESETYDALVDMHSSFDQIDLHGVTVADGVRIALERTQYWWVNLGEDRQKKAREGFTVVTGMGSHSLKGVSPLRQAVGAALKREGWRVRTETAKFVVTGKQ